MVVYMIHTLSFIVQVCFLCATKVYCICYVYIVFLSDCKDGKDYTAWCYAVYVKLCKAFFIVGISWKLFGRQGVTLDDSGSSLFYSVNRQIN